MGDALDGGFSFLIGFGSAHIIIAAILLGLAGALASGIVWLTRGKVLKALPGLGLIILVPMMVIGIIPGMEAFDVPVALALLVLALYLHIQPGEARTKADVIIAAMLGLTLVAFVVVQALTQLSSGRTES